MKIRDKKKKPLEKLITKIKHFDAFYGTNISSTKIYFLIKNIHRTALLSELVLHTHLIWVSISKYIDNGTAKVPISAKIGVRVQGPTSEICN